MLCAGCIPTYYVPEELVPKIQQAREILSDIDSTCRNDPKSQQQKREKGLLKMNIVPVKIGTEIEIVQSKVHNGIRYFLRPFEVSHCGHPSLGYNLVSKTTVKKLKEEYIGMDKKELGNLARSDVAITNVEVIEKIEACYTGDTNLDGLLLTNEVDNDNIIQDGKSSLSRNYLQQGFQAPLVMCELTYLLENERELAKTRGHMNLFDIEPILNSHNWQLTKDDDNQYENSSSLHSSIQNDKKVIFYHLSSRGRTAHNILETMASVLPKGIADISEVALASFSSKDLADIIQENGCISISAYLKRS